MIKLGDFNDLEVIRESSIGYYLDGTDDGILLPYGNTLERKLELGEKIHAFIYRDSKDRLIATLKTPLATIHTVAYLEVKSITELGAFVDFGLERDIFVPIKEQKYKLELGRKYLFYIYEDKTHRLAATTDIDRALDIWEDVTLGEETTGTIYGYQTNGSLMIAVNGLCRGVILNNEYFSDLRPGDEVKVRVKKIYEDGKVGVTPRRQKLEERSELQEKILQYLKDNGGSMSYNDKTSPETIKEIFNSSKNYFKMALGGLMRQNLITQDENGTKLIKK
ncbi:S1 RNA-binding domain-containing protein [Clostridium manihotivorum]|uniref:DNA-binding protein n=1 Tax=Clostridium manihotivorum TaxID=2320868 RepID=A0A410DY60_9CLOT|nr:S1-like domain-containing RNA-binding protein [Clostridium manihotivorum]QAA33852.1 DNA-binding protein [Clostridium manihotivorum]